MSPCSRAIQMQSRGFLPGTGAICRRSSAGLERIECGNGDCQQTDRTPFFNQNMTARSRRERRSALGSPQGTSRGDRSRSPYVDRHTALRRCEMPDSIFEALRAHRDVKQLVGVLPRVLHPLMEFDYMSLFLDREVPSGAGWYVPASEDQPIVALTPTREIP